MLDRLTPAERVAFVLHDMFQVPFDEIARLTDRSPAAARQAASRARRRVQGAEIPVPDADIAKQRKVVDAFFTAARAGDFDTLVKVLDPDVVLRADLGPDRPPAEYHGVADVAKLARARQGAEVHPVLINGQVGVLITVNDRPFSILAFTVVEDKILEINSIRPDRIRGLDAAIPPEKA